MDLSKVFKSKITDSKIDEWIKHGLNVLLIGDHGVGKTTLVKSGFDRNFKKYSILSGATLDPWTDLIGIPTKEDVDGESYIKYIRPRSIDNDLEAIFIDEFNRSKPAVRNALMELLQFKSINGKLFPNLKVVWGAINPNSDEGNENEKFSYDVDRIDPAQMDRFQIWVQLPNEPSLSYFKSKYDSHFGSCLVDWWKNQPEEVKKMVSPRRLDYVGEIFKMGGNIKEVLPVNANVTKLISDLSTNPQQFKIKSLASEFPKNVEAVRELFLKDNSYEKYIKDELGSKLPFHFEQIFDEDTACKYIEDDISTKGKLYLSSISNKWLDQLHIPSGDSNNVNSIVSSARKSNSKIDDFFSELEKNNPSVDISSIEIHPQLLEESKNFIKSLSFKNLRLDHQSIDRFFAYKHLTATQNKTSLGIWDTIFTSYYGIESYLLLSDATSYDTLAKSTKRMMCCGLGLKTVCKNINLLPRGYKFGYITHQSTNTMFKLARIAQFAEETDATDFIPNIPIIETMIHLGGHLQNGTFQYSINKNFGILEGISKRLKEVSYQDLIRHTATILASRNPSLYKSRISIDSVGIMKFKEKKPYLYHSVSHLLSDATGNLSANKINNAIKKVFG